MQPTKVIDKKINEIMGNLLGNKEVRSRLVMTLDSWKTKATSKDVVSINLKSFAYETSYLFSIFLCGANRFEFIEQGDYWLIVNNEVMEIWLNVKYFEFAIQLRC